MTSRPWLVSEQLLCTYNLHQLTFLLEPSIRSVLNILGDLSDFYSKTQDLRGRLVAVVQGRDFHLI
jgi:hypothetical protein